MAKKQLIIKGADFSANGIDHWQDITSRFALVAGYTNKLEDGTEGTSSAYQGNRTAVDISGFTKIKITAPKLRTSAPAAGICFYTTSERSSFISGVAFNSDTSMESSTIEERIIQIPSGANYIRTTYWADNSQYVDEWVDFSCKAM